MVRASYSSLRLVMPNIAVKSSATQRSRSEHAVAAEVVELGSQLALAPGDDSARTSRSSGQISADDRLYLCRSRCAGAAALVGSAARWASVATGRQRRWVPAAGSDRAAAAGVVTGWVATCAGVAAAAVGRCPRWLRSVAGGGSGAWRRRGCTARRRRRAACPPWRCWRRATRRRCARRLREAVPEVVGDDGVGTGAGRLVRLADDRCGGAATLLHRRCRWRGRSRCGRPR